MDRQNRTTQNSFLLCFMMCYTFKPQAGRVTNMSSKAFIPSERRGQANTDEHPDYLTLNKLLTQLKLLMHSFAPQKRHHYTLTWVKKNNEQRRVKIYDMLGSDLGKTIERIICLWFNRAAVISLHPSSPSIVKRETEKGGGEEAALQHRTLSSQIKTDDRPYERINQQRRRFVNVKYVKT